VLRENWQSVRRPGLSIPRPGAFRDVDERTGVILEAFGEIEPEDVPNMHRTGRTTSGDNKVCLPRACGGEKRVDIPLGVKDVTANEWVVWKLCFLCRFEAVCPELFEETAVIDCSLDGIRCDSECIVWHSCGHVDIRSARQPNPSSEAQQRQSAVLSTSRERRQRQQRKVDTMVKPTKLAGLTMLLQWERSQDIESKRIDSI